MFKQQNAARELERELGLRIVPTRRDLRKENRKANSVRLERREIEKPFARRVARAALGDFQQAVSWGDLEARLARRDLRLEPAKRGGGVNVSDGQKRAGLARVDNNLSGPRLADRYGETLRQYCQRHPERPRLVRPFDRPDVTPPLPIEAHAENLVRHLAAQRATWSEDDLRRLSDRDLDGDALLRRALESEQVVTVGTGARGEDRFASRDYLESERRMFAADDALASGADSRLPGDAVAALLEERFAHHLSHEQRDAVLHATTGQDLALIVGRAGAGKTRLTRAVVEAYREAGYRVRGAALAGKAAEGLAAEAGIEARTLASYEQAWRKRRGELTSRDVLLVDEAGMIDVHQTRRVLEHAQERGAKVIWSETRTSSRRSARATPSAASSSNTAPPASTPSDGRPTSGSVKPRSTSPTAGSSPRSRPTPSVARSNGMPTATRPPMPWSWPTSKTATSRPISRA